MLSLPSLRADRASEACRCSIFRDGALWSPEPRAALARPSPDSCTRRVPRWCLPAAPRHAYGPCRRARRAGQGGSGRADRSQAAEQLIAAADADGGPDVLINNAGLTRDNLALRMKDEDWQTVLEVNLTAVFRLIRAALRGMLRRRWGRIINVTSIVALTGNPGQANYAAAKAGMIGMTKSLAAEVASRGITVNCVAPGFIQTPMTAALSEDQRRRLLARAGRTARRPRRCRCRNRLSGQRGSCLCDWPDSARQRRHGHDLTARGRRRVLTPSQPWRDCVTKHGRRRCARMVAKKRQRLSQASR